MYQTHIIFIIKNIILFVASFGVALALAPALIHFLYRYKAWKKTPKQAALGGGATPVFTKFHAEKETHTPRMGGILIWVSVLAVTGGAFLVSHYASHPLLRQLNFISRAQTWLPLFTLISASLLGLIDDVLVVKNRGGYLTGGLRLWVRLSIIVLIALIGAWWFHYKLEWSTIYVPFYGNISIGAGYIGLFIIVVLATFSSGIVDGLDGLSAGVLAPIFAAFGIIAYSREMYDLTSLVIVLIGALATYLWYNVHPAKFYMGETGIMGLTVTLAVIAFLTNSVLFLPVIGFVLVVETASDIIQIGAKKIFHRKIFQAAPIHHHFQAIGWPESQITMRFWIVSCVSSAFGLMLYFLSRFLR